MTTPLFFNEWLDQCKAKTTSITHAVVALDDMQILATSPKDDDELDGFACMISRTGDAYELFGVYAYENDKMKLKRIVSHSTVVSVLTVVDLIEQEIGIWE